LQLLHVFLQKKSALAAPEIKSLMLRNPTHFYQKLETFGYKHFLCELKLNCNTVADFSAISNKPQKGIKEKNFREKIISKIIVPDLTTDLTFVRLQ
jgi:hypothetical protein